MSTLLDFNIYMPVVISKELSVSPSLLSLRGENLLSASTEVPMLANNNINKSFVISTLMTLRAY